jgi:uncharacterized protein involved in outer membrane biogenesis
LRRWRWQIAAVLFTATLPVGAELAGWPFLRQPLARLLSDASGRPVRLSGPFELKLLVDPSLHAGRIEVAAARGEGEALLQASQFEAHWGWLALWRWQRGGELRLKSLSAQALNARLVRDGAGRANWQGGNGSGSHRWPQIGWLAVERGLISFDDAVAGTQLRVRMQGAERGDAAATAGTGYEIDVQGAYTGRPLTLRVRSVALLPLVRSDSADAHTAPVAIQLQGTFGRARVRFDGHAAALAGTPRLQGNVRLQAGSMAAVGDVLGLTLPRTPPFDLRGELRHAAGVWQLRDVAATVGESRLGGSFRYDTRSTPPRLSGQLTGAKLLLSDLGPAVGTSAPGDGASVASKRVLPYHEFALPALGRMDAALQIDIDELSFGTAQLQAMQGLRARLELQHSVLQLQDLQAKVAGGRVWGRTELDGRKAKALWSADLRFAGIEVSQWIRAVRAPATASGGTGHAQPTPYLSGELLGAVHVRGQGTSSAQILASLDGQAQLRLRAGTVSHLLTELAGLDLAQALGVAVVGDDALALHCARFDLLLRQGVVQPQLAVIDNRDSTVQLQGRVDLSDETLDLHSTVKPKDVSPLSLRAPLRISGTLAAPEVSVDVAPLAAKALASAALGMLATPVAALLPWLDLGSTADEAPCAAVAPASAASAPRSR